MKKLSPTAMKWLKAVHITLIAMWTIGVCGMLLFDCLPAENGHEFLYHQKAVVILDYWFTIPGALLAVLTGIIYGLFTNWGFFRYRWLTLKWIVGIAVICLGSFWTYDITEQMILLASSNTDAYLTDPFILYNLPLVRAVTIVQAVALVAMIPVSVFKPWIKKTAWESAPKGLSKDE